LASIKGNLAALEYLRRRVVRTHDDTAYFESWRRTTGYYR